MSFELSVRSGDKLLRCGYTTGTCAALAAMGAIRLLLGFGESALSITVPDGHVVTVEPEELRLNESGAICCVKKYAGDDIDVTAGLDICAQVRLFPCTERKVTIDGGIGIGRVTLPGLDQPVGNAAINSVPRSMIENACLEAMREAGYIGGAEVIIFAPKGAEAAAKTFNPRLGIEGGISILGTSGIVRPQSLQALKDSVELEIRQKAELGYRSLLLTPGNYGSDFAAKKAFAKDIPQVMCSNFIGESLDAAGLYGFKQVLLVGHIGKLVKLAGGIMDTHSRVADCRVELIAAHAALCGAAQDTTAALMSAPTTDACLDILKAKNLNQSVVNSLLSRIEQHLSFRSGGKYECGAVLFSLQHGELGMTDSAKKIIEEFSA